MKMKKLILFAAKFSLILFITLSWTPVSALSENNSNTFSFRFENCTVTAALKELSEKSGVKIVSNGIIKKEIFQRSYNNKKLDSIIKDLLRGEDCSVVWNYRDGNLFSVNLYTPDENDVKGNAAGPNTFNRTNINRNSFPDNADIDEITANRENYTRSRQINNRNRSNTSAPASRTPATSRRTTTENSAGFGSSRRTNTDGNSVSGTSSIPANIRRALINKENNEEDTDNEIDQEEITPPPTPEAEDLPEPPEPETGSGLERPPMPPGM
jgi:hypothetical protein